MKGKKDPGACPMKHPKENPPEPGRTDDGPGRVLGLRNGVCGAEILPLLLLMPQAPLLADEARSA